MAGLALFLALDAAIFGSGFFLKWVAPDSGLGRVIYAMRATKMSPRANGGIFVFGNSLMAEGFSAKLANAEAARVGASPMFFNNAVPGTSPRNWYYMLRDLRDSGIRPAAVILMARDYRDSPDIANTEDRVADLGFLAPYIGWRDITSFPFSFQRPDARLAAIEAVLVKGWLLHGDIEDFLLHPYLRVSAVKLWRKEGTAILYDYQGHPETLAGVSLDPATGTLGWGPNEANPPPGLRGDIVKLQADLPGLKETPVEGAQPEVAQYIRDWYGAVAKLCREMGAKLIVLRPPRGPLQFMAPPDDEAHGALADLAAAGELRLLKADTFDDLERPRFFFDHVHMNRVGREDFSPRLAREALRLLSP